MKVFTLHLGYFKLDGGAMYGVVPKSMWSKYNTPDEQNLCTWSLRSLLVDTGERVILVDTGIGTKQDDKFRSHFHPHNTVSIQDALANIGYHTSQVTDVFLTHLHFDHCGGALEYDEHKQIVPTLPNAKYWSCRSHMEWAKNPNPREAASFLKENILPLESLGVLEFIKEATDTEWLPGIHVQFCNGHTIGMMTPSFEVGDKKVVFCADLLPSHTHISLPWLMAYDIQPMESLKEKAALLEGAATNGWILVLEHDAQVECCTVKFNESGRIVLDRSGDLKSFL